MSGELTLSNNQNLATTDTDLFSGATYDQKLALFAEIAKGNNTGIKTVGDAVMVWQKAKELGIGWGNAVPHMHVVNGKAGIDIHIIKALLSKPKSGISWVCTEDYKVIYRYTDGVNVFIGEDSLPSFAEIVDNLKTPVSDNKKAFIIMPDMVKEGNITKLVINPYDYRTKYIFTRKKLDIDGKWIVTTSDKGVFSWRDALTAQLPYDKTGILNESSVWQKYRKLMLDHRAYTLGARDIASDLLMGCFETKELYDINGFKYEVTEDGNAILVD